MMTQALRYSETGTHFSPQINFFHDPMGFGQDFKRLKLIELSHKPQSILDAVKDSEFTSRIDPIQLDYKQHFVAIYKRWAGEKILSNEGRFQNFSEGLELAMYALDRFFFGGSLCADLKAQDDVFCEGQLGGHLRDYAGYLGVTETSEDGHAFIYIDTSPTYRSHRTVEGIFETLLHEMAHAIYESFTCRCSSCIGTTDRREILGQRGHGELWSKMAKHMRATIQTWDDDLANFWENGDIERFYLNRDG